MNLNEALTFVAERMNLDAAELIDYAAEDTLTGSLDGIYSNISVTAEEGHLLYALVRALRPVYSVEVGHHSGCSASHLLAAMEANQIGILHSIDVNSPSPPGVPDDVRVLWSFEQLDARYYAWPPYVDFVFEDGDHTRHLTATILRNAIEHHARCVISHDAYNANVGTEIRAGFEEVVGDGYFTVTIDDRLLGFAIWYRGA